MNKDLSWKRQNFFPEKKTVIGFWSSCLLLRGCFRGQKDRKRHCQSDKFRRNLNGATNATPAALRRWGGRSELVIQAKDFRPRDGEEHR